VGLRETNVGFAGRAGREERRDAQQHIGTRARRLRMRVVQEGRASMKIAAQIMRGIGCHSCDTKMYHLGMDFSGSSFLPYLMRFLAASSDVKPSCLQ